MYLNCEGYLVYDFFNMDKLSEGQLYCIPSERNLVTEKIMVSVEFFSAGVLMQRFYKYKVSFSFKFRLIWHLSSLKQG
ncbi:hypothetical protein VNO80_17708 [Phaseolus coccineus]|uniref:Uncharacterized protein n=1 Tax=Phaseolus coccineus TaxID=3886 RepID=A0AAN9MHT6_PHACN